MNKIEYISRLKRSLLDIDIVNYILTEFSGKDFEPFDETSKDFDRENVKDLRHNINSYLNLLNNYFDYLKSNKQAIELRNYTFKY